MTTYLSYDYTQTIPNSDDRHSIRGMAARAMAMAYQITKNSMYSNKAKEALFNMDVGSYTSGFTDYIYTERATALEGFLFAYDWLYPLLTPAENAMIRDKLALSAHQVFEDCKYYPTSRGLHTRGLSYFAAAIASAALYDYTNPNGLPIPSTPAMWRVPAREYMFGLDLYQDRSLDQRFPTMWDWGFDANGRYFDGDYKMYFFDDAITWYNVSNRFFGENYIQMYPQAKNAFMCEVWDSLPNHYSDNHCCGANLKWGYQKAMLGLLSDDEKAIALNHTDRTDAQHLLYHSSDVTGGSQGGFTSELYYCTYYNYPTIQRKYPDFKNKLNPDPKAITQLIRGSWEDDSDWLSMGTFRYTNPLPP